MFIFFRGGRAEVSEILPQGFQRPASPVLDVWVENFLNLQTSIFSEAVFNFF